MRGLQPGQRGHLGPALHLEHAHRVGPAEHVVDLVLLRDGGEVDLVDRGARATRSMASCSAVSMPRPSRSNFTRPTAAQSSLSHWSTVRSFMRAHSTGHTSMTGRSQITMPPEWMPRWRGKSSTSSASSQHVGGDVVVGPGAAGDLDPPPGVDLLRPGVLLAGGEPEGLGHVPHRRAGPVGDDVGHLGGVLAAVAARRRTGWPPPAGRSRCRRRCRAGRRARATGSARTAGRGAIGSALVMPRA